MKKVLFSLGMIFLIILAHGQVPNKFNYQAVIRNADGTLPDDSEVIIGLKILDMGAGGAVVFEETHHQVPNKFGLVNLVIGENNVLDVSWAEGPYNLEVTVDGNVISSTQLLAVPFALLAENVVNNEDADADPSNELQDLKFENNVLTITGNPGATPITIPDGPGDKQWLLSGDSVSITDKNIGIGTNSPTGKLVVMGDGEEAPEEPLFEVKKVDGQTVFAVYNDRAEFYVDENPLAKGVKGGFAVGGYNARKGTTTDFMRLTADNYFIGQQSGEKITSGLYNSTLGYQAGTELTSGSQNIFLGYQSGFNNIDGKENTFMGYQAGFKNTSGQRNTFIGYGAGYENTIGNSNIFLGYEAGLSNTEGNLNMFFGYRAGASNTSGEGNMFFGSQAGSVNTTGSYNMFVGPDAGYSNVNGENNLFMGFQAGYANTSGSNNLFIGENAGYANLIGYSNIFIGSSAGRNNISGAANLFIGFQSGYGNKTGNFNTLIGDQSGYYLKDGVNNTFLGFEAGYTSNGTQNVYIGSKSGRANKGSNNIFIGTGAGGNVDSISNTLIIDNNIDVLPENSLIYGKFNEVGWDELKLNALVGILRTPSANELEVEGDASKSVAGAWLANSDMRIKTDIQDIENAFEVMLKLHPVKFRYTDEYKSSHPGIVDKFYYNYLAQEYKEVFPDAVKSSGERLESAQDEILQMDSYNAQIYSIKAVQELILESEKNSAQIDELYKMVEELRSNNPANPGH